MPHTSEMLLSTRRRRRFRRIATLRATPHPVLMEELETRMLLSAVSTAFLLSPTNTILHASADNAPSGYTPAQIRQAYGINQILFGDTAGDGAGQTIAIIDAYNDPTITSDLHAFDQLFGLSDPSLTRLNQNGGASLPSSAPDRGNSWALEIALDVEWAHAVAPAANLLVVEASSASDSDLAAAVNTARNYPGVSVISMSWGGTEGPSALNDSLFTTPAGHTPITFIASAGDQGAFTSPAHKAVEFPASSKNVLAVGGTRLNITATGNYNSESGWGSGNSSYNNGGSGGGISAFEAQPSFQNSIVSQSSAFRTVPDVAFDADPTSGAAVYDSYDSPNNPWLQVGGTSLGAPAWAGLIAIADQGRALSGLSTLDGPSQTLPALYALPNADFHDITSGTNGYAAGPGYDLVTGRGTPIANKLIPDLAGATSNPTTPNPTPSAAPVIGSFTLSANQIIAGTNVTLFANDVTDAAASIISLDFYQETNDIPGLQTLTDSLIGAATRDGNNWSLTATTAGVAPGTYSLYALATDADGQTSSATVTLSIAAPAAPANDAFSHAARLSGTSLSLTASTIGATKESGEPDHAGNPGGHSVWYAWTPSQSGVVSLNTLGSNFDTLLAVYTGNNVGDLTRVAANDDAPHARTHTSALTFNAVAGATYYLAIDGYNGAAGKIVLNLSEAIARPRHTGITQSPIHARTTRIQSPKLLKITTARSHNLPPISSASALPILTTNATNHPGAAASLDHLATTAFAPLASILA